MTKDTLAKAESRVTSILAEIGEQLSSIKEGKEIEAVVNDKDMFIRKQTAAINDCIEYTIQVARDKADELADKDRKIESLKSDVERYSRYWHEASSQNKLLKDALKSLAQALEID